MRPGIDGFQAKNSFQTLKQSYSGVRINCPGVRRNNSNSVFELLPADFLLLQTIFDLLASDFLLLAGDFGLRADDFLLARPVFELLQRDFGLSRSRFTLLQSVFELPHDDFELQRRGTSQRRHRI